MAIKSKSQEVKAYFDQPQLYLHKKFGVRLRAFIVQDLIDHLMQTQPALIDLGCGNGDLTLPYLSQTSRHDFLDISDNMLDLVRNKIPEEFLNKVTTYCGDLVTFVPNQRYDIVIAYGLIMHVESVEKSMDRIVELTKPGGYILIQFTSHKHLFSRINRWLQGQMAYEVNHISVESFKKEVARKKLKTVDHRRYGLLLRGMGKLPDSILYSYHKATYTNALLRSLGMDHVFLLEKPKS